MIKVAHVIERPNTAAACNARSNLDALSASIRARLNNMQKDVLQIGRDLLQAKEILGHGKFQPWLETEFAWSIRTAQRYMNIAARLGDKYDSLSHLPVEVLYKLSAPKTPDDVVDAVFSRAQAGEKLTGRAVAAIVRQKRAAPVRPADERSRSRKIADKFSGSRTTGDDDPLNNMTHQAYLLLKAKLEPPRLKRIAFLLERCDVGRLAKIINEHLEGDTSSPSGDHAFTACD